MIYNKTTNEKINIKIKIADSYFKRLMGLMFKKDIDYGLVFITKYGSSIHTSFMRFNIDAYFLNEKKEVIDMAHLRPWSSYKPIEKAKYIIEAKENILNLKKGDKLEISYI